MNEKRLLSKNVRRSRNNKCKRIKQLRKARDIASRDAAITRHQKSVWKLKDLVPYYIQRLDYLFVENLAEEIYDGNGWWLRKAPPVPVTRKS